MLAVSVEETEIRSDVGVMYSSTGAIKNDADSASDDALDRSVENCKVAVCSLQFAVQIIEISHER